MRDGTHAQNGPQVSQPGGPLSVAQRAVTAGPSAGGL